MRLGLFDVSGRWPRQRTRGNDGTIFREPPNFSLSSVKFVDLILSSNSHEEIWTRLHAPAISSDIWRSGCVHFRRLWNGMCDRHRAEITVIQFTGHSLPVHHFVTARWDLHLVPYCPAKFTNTISSDYWPLGCVTSAIFGIACLAGSKLNIQHHQPKRHRHAPNEGMDGYR